MVSEEKTGTIEELQADMKQCGFHPDEAESQLEGLMALTRMKIDNALQEILAESNLPLFLFDYLITSVQSDIRKADLDTTRVSRMRKVEEE